MAVIWTLGSATVAEVEDGLADDIDADELRRLKRLVETTRKATRR